MIEIFRCNGKWRIKVTNETFEFDSSEEFEMKLESLIKLKEEYEPHENKKEKENKPKGW